MAKQATADQAEQDRKPQGPPDYADALKAFLDKELGTVRTRQRRIEEALMAAAMRLGSFSISGAELAATKGLKLKLRADAGGGIVFEATDADGKVVRAEEGHPFGGVPADDGQAGEQAGQYAFTG